LALAQWLEKHPNVQKVSYPGLESSPYHELAKKYLPKGPGAVLSFELKGGKESATKFVDNLKMISHLANVGDTKTLIIQPSATTHQQLSDEEQLSAGVTPTQLRVAVGIEHIDDIIADIDQSLKIVFA
jgi:O-acetylhomoserine (thiol)-lyase